MATNGVFYALFVSFFIQMTVFSVFQRANLAKFSGFSVYFSGTFIFPGQNIFVILQVIQQKECYTAMQPYQTIVYYRVLMTEVTISSEFRI